MGSSNSKQDGERGNNRRRTSIKRILHIRPRGITKPPRPVSYAGTNQQHEHQQQTSTRPMSMFDTVLSNDRDETHEILPTDDIETRLQAIIHSETPPDLVALHSTAHISRQTESTTTTTTDQTHRVHFDLNPISSVDSDDSNDHTTTTTTCLKHDINQSGLSYIDKSYQNHLEHSKIDYQNYIPLTLEKLRTIKILKETIFQRLNFEYRYTLDRLLRLNNDENEEFFEWFFDQFESIEEKNSSNQSSLLLRTIEQNQFDLMKYLLDHQLLSSKLHINLTNEQGRHCLLMLTHKNVPIHYVNYLLTRHLACLDTNKIDLNRFSALHHSCRHFNLPMCQILLPHTNSTLLQLENSELRTPLDYWLECLCSLKKLKPTHLQHESDTLRLDYLLNEENFRASVSFLQILINRGGQLNKIPLRYIRAVFPQLSFEQKLAYVDHHVNLCCTLYKNRLSTLVRDYDTLKMSIQAGEILTEFIFALGTVQLEVQNRLAAHAYSSVYGTAVQRLHREEEGEDPNNQNTIRPLTSKEHDMLQVNMRMLYFKFFRLFECIYNNPDINVKNFHFEHIFRRVWVYWKEPVRAFITQCRERNCSLKSICRIQLFRRLVNYPHDLQQLPINSSLKKFLAYDNQFFIVERKY